MMNGVGSNGEAPPLLRSLQSRVAHSSVSEYRAVSVAEAVANDLRHKIVTGELSDGSQLPRQEDLLRAYGVSKPSLREALRILESEGLISVRRGKVGGAIIHRPDFHNVAYSIGMVLESQGVPVPDLSMALNLIEPQCVALCAQRPDRDTEVIPHLRKVHDAAAEAVDDMATFTRLSRRFHEVLVSVCGNHSLTLVVGALEAVWSAHAREWAALGAAVDRTPDIEYRRQGLADHEGLIRLIEAGDVDGARAEASRHLRWAPVYSVDEEFGLASWASDAVDSTR